MAISRSQDADAAASDSNLTGFEAPQALDDDPAFEALLRRAAQLSEPSAARARAPLAIGTKLAAARITVLRRIGAGGMGVVYEAFDTERRARVALKTLAELDAAGVYRLKSEFRALSHVGHPNLVQLHELFSDGGRWFFTMDLIEGEAFDRWVRPQALDEVRLRSALSQLIAAIEAIHRGGKLHRDLKPSNVLVTAEGRVVVLDFGMVATPQLGGVWETLADGKVIGTPAYMAPEQAAGGSATKASDLYALGVMLFEALTGRQPFEGRAGEVLAAKQLTDAPSTCSVAPAAPADLSALCDRLLLRDPAQRPNLAALHAALGSPSEGRASKPHPSLAPERQPAFFGRKAELDCVREAYENALAGRATVLFVSGESGMGKSALVGAFLDELRERGEAVLLAGRCNERENVPYKALDALVDELSRHLRRIPAQEAAALMPREAFTLSRLFPVLDRVPVIAEGPKKSISNLLDLQARAFAAFGELMARMRDRQPLVLFIDDLQWTDEDSVRFIQHLLLYAAPVPALMVFAHRSEQAEHNVLLQSVIEAAVENRAVSVRKLAVGALDEVALGALVVLQLEDSPDREAQARLIAREAGGSPFLAGELARAASFLESSAPMPTLTVALSQHVDRLPTATRRLLTVLALAGQPLASAVAVEAAGLEGHAQLDLLRSERLIRVSIASDQGRAVECYHDRVRELVAGEVEASLSRELFAGLARALHGSPNPDPELLTRCLEGAGLTEQASIQASQAADRAMLVLAFERAARLYEKALLLGNFDAESARSLRIARADALSRAGQGALASELYLKARDGAEPARSAELTRHAGVQLLMLGRQVRGRELLAEGLRPLGIRIPKTSGTAFLALIWARLRLWVRGLKFVPRAEQDPITVTRLEALRSAATSFAPSDSLRFAFFSAHWFHLALRSGHAVELARAIGGELVLASYMPNKRKRIPALTRLAESLVDGTMTDADAQFSIRWGRAWSCLTDVPWCGEWSVSLAHAESCLELAKEHPVSIGAYVEPWCQYLRATILSSLGRFHEVSRIVQTQFELELLGRNLTVLPPLSVLAAFVLPGLGQLEEAERIVRESRSVWLSDEVTVQDLNLLLAISLLSRYRREAQEGWQEFRVLWKRIDASLMPRIIMGPLMNGMGGTLAAAAAQETSQVSERNALLREASRMLTRAASSGSQAARLSARTQVACLAGDRPRAAGYLREILGLTNLSPLVQHATTRQLGSLLGGSEGGLYVERADSWFRERGVVDPSRLSAVLMPGPDFL